MHLVGQRMLVLRSKRRQPLPLLPCQIDKSELGTSLHFVVLTALALESFGWRHKIRLLSAQVNRVLLGRLSGS